MPTLPADRALAPFYPFYQFDLQFEAPFAAMFARLSVRKVLSTDQRTLIHCIAIRRDAEISFDFGGDLSDLSLVLKCGGVLEIQQLPWDVHCAFVSQRMISTRSQRLSTQTSFRCKTPLWDHASGVLQAQSVGAEVDLIDNQRGLIQAAQQLKMRVKRLLENTEGSLLGGHQVEIEVKGFIHNRSGRILALDSGAKLLVKSTGHIRNEHGGWMAGQGHTQIISPHFKSDENSRIGPLMHKNLDGTLLSAPIDLEVGTFHVEAPLLTQSLQIKSEALYVFADLRTASGAICLQGKRLFQAANTILGGQWPQSTIDLQIDAMDIRGAWGPRGCFRVHALKAWSFAPTLFQQGIDLDLQLLINRDIHFRYPMDLQSLRLQIDQAANSPHPYTVSFEESLMADQSVAMAARQSRLKIGNPQRAHFTPIRTRTGPLSVEARAVEMPFGVLYGAGPVRVYSQETMVLGDLDHPTQISHLRSDVSISLETQDQLRSYHLNLDVEGDFYLKAPNNWYDVGGSTFVGGCAVLDTPLNEHRMHTQPLSYAQDIMANVLNPHAVRNGITTATLRAGSPPVFMAHRIQATGQTHMIGGPLYASIFEGAPPITDSFTESYHNYSETKYGHRKERKATWYGGTSDWSGQTFLSSFGTHTSTFERASIHLPGIVRASTLKLLAFNDCLIGSLNPQQQSLGLFRPCVDLLEYARPNTALVEGGMEAPTLFIDCLSLKPSMPSRSRVVASPEGLRVGSDLKPLYPWSEERKLIAIAFLHQLGQLPPEDDWTGFHLEALGDWLMENTLAWMQGLEPEAQVDILALIQRNPLHYPTNPILLYTAIPYRNQAGVMTQVLKPMLILPTRYERLSVHAQGHLIAQALWMKGADEAQLQITHGVEGLKLVSVDVDTILLETIPVVWQETLTQIQYTRHFLRKKTQRTEQTVQCAQVQSLASLRTEGELRLKTKHLKQVGAVLKGGSKPSILEIGCHTAIPVVEQRARGYAAIRHSLLGKAHVQGSVLHTSIVPSRLVCDSTLEGRVAQAHYQALAVSTQGPVRCVFDNLQFYPSVIRQSMPPQIDARGRSLIIQHAMDEYAKPTAFRLAQGALSLESKGLYDSVASQYQAPGGITLKAKRFQEGAQILVHTFVQHRLGVEGLSVVCSHETGRQETAQLASFITDRAAAIVIEACEGATVVAPQVQGGSFRLTASEGDAHLSTVAITQQRAVHTQHLSLQLSSKPAVSLSLERETEHSLGAIGADLRVNTILVQAGRHAVLEGFATEATRMEVRASHTVLISGVPRTRVYTQQSSDLCVGFDLASQSPFMAFSYARAYQQTQDFLASVASRLEQLVIEAETIHLRNGVSLRSRQAVIDAQHFTIEQGIERQDNRSEAIKLDSSGDLKRAYHIVRHQSYVPTGIYAEDCSMRVQSQHRVYEAPLSPYERHHDFHMPLGLIMGASRRRSTPAQAPDAVVFMSGVSETQEIFGAPDACVANDPAVFEATVDRDPPRAPQVMRRTPKLSVPTTVLSQPAAQNAGTILGVGSYNPAIFDPQIARRITANSQDSSSILRQGFEKVDAFFQESHRLMDSAEQGAETVYRAHPDLRRDADVHTAGFRAFRRIVPKDGQDLIYKTLFFTGGPKAVQGSVRGLQWAYGQAKVGYNLHTLDSRAEINHIFSKVRGQPKHGHLADTPQNRRVIVETFSHQKYFKGVDEHGKAWFRRTLADERECWVTVQNGRVKSGGVNPRPMEGVDAARRAAPPH